MSDLYFLFPFWHFWVSGFSKPSWVTQNKRGKGQSNRIETFGHICLFLILDSASLIAQLVKNQPAMQETWFDSWVGKIPWRRDRLRTPIILGFPGGSVGKESTCNAGDLGSIPGLGRSSGGGHGNPFLYSCLKNPHGQRSLVGCSPWGCKELDTGHLENPV